MATLQPAAVVYREEQYFDWRVYALIVAGRGRWSGRPRLAARQRGHARPPCWPLELALEVSLASPWLLALPVVLVVGLLRMTTEVDPDRPPRLVRLGPDLPPGRRRSATIRRIEVVSYRPIADYGGWGIRSGRDGERVLNARGNRGVRLELADGTRLLIGSQRPEELAETIERVHRTDIV